MKREVPRLTTEEEAEAFLEQDLPDLDFSQFKPVRFEPEKPPGAAPAGAPGGHSIQITFSRDKPARALHAAGAAAAPTG